MSVPDRPSPPNFGKITHHNIELIWDSDGEVDTMSIDSATPADMRRSACVQSQDKNGGWSNIYTGYSKSFTVEGLTPWTQYCFRIRFQNKFGNSEWSPGVMVSTIKEPMNGEHLHKAIFLENLDKLESVLETGDVHPDIPDKYGFTPLMQAAQKGYLEMIEMLIRYGADVNFQNDAGKTALMLAAYSGKIPSVKELRYSGASYDVQDKGGSTALHWAMDSGNTELIGWMLDDGADINVVDVNEWTPLLRTAAVSGNADVANTLMRHGTEIDKRDKDGKTALMMAVVNGHERLVKLLLDSGADMTITNEFGKDAYDMAISMEKRRVIKVLDDFKKTHGL